MFTVMRIIVGSKAIYSVLKKTDPRHCAIKLPNRFSCDLIASCCRGSVFSDTMYCRSISIVSQFMVSFCFILLMLKVWSWPVMCVILEARSWFWGQALILRSGLGLEARSWSWGQALVLTTGLEAEALVLRSGLGLDARSWGLGLEVRSWSWRQVLRPRPWSWGQVLVLTPGLGLDTRPLSWCQVLRPRPGLGLEVRSWSWRQALVLTPGLCLEARSWSWRQVLVLTPGLSLDARPCSWGQVLWSWPWELHWQFLASPLNAGKTLKLIIVIVTN